MKLSRLHIPPQAVATLRFAIIMVFGIVGFGMIQSNQRWTGTLTGQLCGSITLNAKEGASLAQAISDMLPPSQAVGVAADEAEFKKETALLLKDCPAP